MNVSEEYILAHLCVTSDTKEYCVNVIPESLFEKAVNDGKLSKYEVPVTYSHFQKCNYRVYEGHIICDVKYDDELGVIEDESSKKKKYYTKGLQTGKKYELVKEDSITRNGHKLYRIRALTYIGNPMQPILGALLEGLYSRYVYPGDLGGYVESEYNLDHNGTSWVHDNAVVIGNAKIIDNAVVGGKSEISEDAIIKDDATVDGESRVSGNAIICNKAEVTDSVIKDRCEIKENACIESSTLSGNVHAGYETWIHESALSGNINLMIEINTDKNKQIQIENASIYDNFTLTGPDTYIYKTEFKNTEIKNIDKLEIRNSKLENCSITDCQSVTIDDYQMENVSISNEEYYDTNDMQYD